MTQQLSIALVGCGNIARAHWRGIRYHAPHLAVTAAVDSDQGRAEAMAERIGCDPYPSLEAALAHGSFDAVDLMLPHDLHEDAAMQCFAAGKHVVLEKPMAMDIASCERILAAAEAAGTVFMIAEQAQYWPDVHKAAALIADDAIGDVLTAQANFFDPLTIDPSDPIPWRFKLARAGGGITIDGGAHWIRPLRIWFGEVEAAVGITARPIAEMEGESLAHAILRFESGITATLHTLQSSATMAPAADFRISGSLGEIVIERGRLGRLMLCDGDHPDGLAVMDIFPGKVDSFGFEPHDFSLAVLEGKALEAPPEYSLGELRTALAIYRSVASGRWEPVW